MSAFFSFISEANGSTAAFFFFGTGDEGGGDVKGDEPDVGNIFFGADNRDDLRREVIDGVGEGEILCTFSRCRLTDVDWLPLAGESNLRDFRV